MRTWIEIALLAVLAVVMLFPVVWMLETSLKENRDVYAVPAKFLGFDLTFEHYKDVFVQRGGSGASDLATNFKNSVIVAGLSTILATALGVPAAWAYSRFQMKAEEGPALLHPLDALHAAGGRRDPDLPDVPGPEPLRHQAGADPDLRARSTCSFTIWMMKGFVDEVPSEYEDAAMLDGYSRLEAFLRVTLPLLIPGIAATAVFALIFSWNEFVFAIFLTSSESARTAPPAIAGLIGGTTIDWGLVAASAMVFAIPVLLFAFLVRKHLVAGVTLGAVRR